jgi:hypothetical protein
MNDVWHFLAHLFRLNGCTLVRSRYKGHEWLFTECFLCGPKSRNPLAHSECCECYDEGNKK